MTLPPTATDTVAGHEVRMPQLAEDGDLGGERLGPGCVHIYSLAISNFREGKEIASKI
jgi:hypothetical protein